MGSASAKPMSDRNPSAQVLAVHGRLFLIDCGEGTQQQLRRAHLSFMKIDAVFITHIHGDHLFGLFGLLSSMAMYGRSADLDIYGPQALGSVLNFYRSFFADDTDFKIVFHPVKCSEPQVVMETKHLKVSAFPLNHKIECYGWRFDELPSVKRPCAEDGTPVHPLKSFAYCSRAAPSFDHGAGGPLRPRCRGRPAAHRALFRKNHRFRRISRGVPQDFSRHGCGE